MLGALLRNLREPDAIPRIADPAVVAATYRRRRNQILLASMVGYGLFYFCRKNISVALTTMPVELDLSPAALGVLNSTIYVTYAISKGASGLVADRANPRTLLLLGLALSVLVNAAFGLSESLTALSVLWALNGVAQGLGAPACSKLLAAWFAVSERGRKTAIWNVSHQGGGGIAAVLAGLFAHSFGWRGAIVGPALVAIGIAFLVAPFLGDRPEAEGLPPIEEHADERPPVEDETAGMSFRRLLLTRVLLNPSVWLVALASGFTYVVRTATLDWCPTFLKAVHGTSMKETGLSASVLELIGIPGALLCGWISDRLGARRAPVVFVSLVLLGASIVALAHVPPGHPLVVTGVMAAIGFFTYGPQLLLAGVAPVDMSSKRVAAAAVGFTGVLSYAGAWASSVVTGSILGAKDLGWPVAFDFWAASAGVAALLCLPLWNRTAAPTRSAPTTSP